MTIEEAIDYCKLVVYSFEKALGHFENDEGLKSRIVAINMAIEALRFQQSHSNSNSRTMCCSNCRHMYESDKTNRLFCYYHEDGEHQHEVMKNHYCSNYDGDEK